MTGQVTCVVSNLAGFCPPVGADAKLLSATAWGKFEAAPRITPSCSPSHGANVDPRLRLNQVGHLSDPVSGRRSTSATLSPGVSVLSRESTSLNE